MKFISNAFSFSMIDQTFGTLVFSELSTSQVVDWVTVNKFTSAIGHKNVADTLSGIIHAYNKSIPPIQTNRVNIEMAPGDQILIVQYVGKERLPEGATTLPFGSSFKFILVTLDI